MKSKHTCIVLLLAATACLPAKADFGGYTNQGLVAVGRVPAGAFDALGEGLDTLGGFGSAAAFDTASWTRQGDNFHGVLYALPDRGFGDGAQNYLPRIQVFDFSVTPYYGAGPAAQNQIVVSNTESILLTYNGVNFTGFDGNDTNELTHPQSTMSSLGQGRRSLDAEGLVRLPDGSFFVSDEYGSFIYKFSATGALERTFELPPSLVPKRGSTYPRTNFFTGATAPDSGRRNNRGLEGLSLTPDGKRLLAMLQSPTIQDGGAGSSGRNTRVLVYDADPASATYGQPLGQYLYELTLRGSATTNKHTPVSEVLALNRTDFLVLERDQLGQGVSGADTNLAPTYKSVVLASTTGATNILNSPYDLERGAPGQVSLAANGVPAGIRPAHRQELINLLDPAQLAKFGLNASVPHTTNTLSEKWESLSLVPLNDPAATNDYLLLVINDNDFKAPVVYHNGIAVGTNEVAMDSILLAYRVTLPGLGMPAPSNQPPTVSLIAPTNSTLSAPVQLSVEAKAYDQDGRIVKVEFWQNTTKLAEDITYPFQFTTNLAPNSGLVAYAVVYDHDGAAATSQVYSVASVANNLEPQVDISSPVNGAEFSAPANFTLAATAEDEDGWIARVVFYRGASPIATNTSRPYQVQLASQPLGTLTYTAVTTDNQGVNSTSAPVSVTVRKNSNTTPLTLQILHASDLEAGIEALEDAPRFSSVLAALKAAYPSNTVVLSSGDNYIPGPFFNAAADPAAGFNGVGGRADIAMLNAMGFQAAAFGNHEFDAGTPQVRSIISRDTAVAYQGAMFPYLSANLNFATDSSMASLVTANGQSALAMTNRVAKSCLVNVDGQLIGIVGATTKDLRSISSPGTVGVDTNLTASVQAAVDDLLPLGVNKIIVLAHLQQYVDEFELARQLRDVDVVIAGGSHAIFAKPSDRLRAGDAAATNYPVMLTSSSEEPVAVVNCGPNYRYLGRFIVHFGTNGAISSFDPSSGAYATDQQGVLDTGGFAPNATVLNIATNLGSIISSKDGNLFGRTEVYLNGLRQYVRTEESNLGNLTADANLWRARLTDPTASISLKNGGGIRDSIGAVLGYGGGAAYVPPLANPSAGKEFGDISQLDIENSLRFNNGLSIITLTAQQLRDTMEWSVAGTAPGATPGQFPQVSGLWFSYNPTNPGMTYTRSGSAITGISSPGSRLRTLVATRDDGGLDLIVENGLLIGDPARTFRMVTLGFLADGGDSYYPLSLSGNRTNLANASGNAFGTDGAEQWALAAYLTNIGTYYAMDAAAAEDLRIQNLSLRADTIAGPKFLQIAVDAQNAVLNFSAVPNYLYRAEASTDLIHWVGLGWATLGNASSYLFIDRDKRLYPQRYYRIVRQELPGVRLAVFSDPHLMDPSLIIADGPAFEAYLAQDRKLLRESSAILESVITEVAAAAPDIVLVTGDLTKDGEFISHQGMTNALARLEAAGSKVFVCPGNHDVRNPHALAYNGTNVISVPSVTEFEFAQLYGAYGYNEAIARDPASLSYVAEPVPGLWLLAMDSCHYERNTNGAPFTGGYFDTSRWTWITNQLVAARQAGKFVIGMLHHGVMEHYQGQKTLFPEYVLDEYQTIREAFASYGMKLVFTGHYHAQDIVKYEHPQGTLFDVETGSTVTYPCPYRVADLEPNGTIAITSQQVTNINYDLGGQSFPAHAYSYLTNGLLGVSMYLLMQPPYSVSQATAELLAPAMTEGFSSHYQGDETTRPISPQTQAIIAMLESQTSNPLSQLMANALRAIFNDPAPSDNHLTIHLPSGATAP